MYKIGDEVRVNRNNVDNSYDEFRGKILTVVEEYYNVGDNKYYDESMGGQGLYELEDEKGILIDCELYAYELEKA